MHIHRDDLLEGGTKRRGLRLLLDDIPSQTVFYAGTVMGHGALALAHACNDIGKQAEIFLSAQNDHPMVHKIRMTNATVHLHDAMPVNMLFEKAMDNAGDRPVLPPGFDMPEFEEALVQAVRTIDLPSHSEIWTCAVTGTLTRALQRAFPAVAFKTVRVVKQECDVGRAEVFTAPEKYHQVAKQLPPYPSCPYTDAKIWQFAQVHAAHDALIWNTAG